MIQVELSAAEITIEPGSTAQLTLSVTNQGLEPDHLFLEIEGVDVEWYALPVPSLNLASGATQTVRVLFKVARTSSSTAGTYPFIVRVRSMETGDSGVQPATLIVTPFSSLQVELNPKRAVSTFLNHAAGVDVIVSNLSNHEDTLDLFGADPEDACAFEFGSERVTVKPGHTETVSLSVEPVSRPLLGSSRLYGYTVTIRSVRDSFVSGTASGQLERRALLSIVGMLGVSALIIAALFFFVSQPRPAVIRAFNVSPRQVVAGEPVTISWEVLGATEGVVILPDDQKRPASGTWTINPMETTNYTLIARFGGGQEKRDSATVTVVPQPHIPAPTISVFKASRYRIHQGDEIKIWWDAQNAARVLLNPLNIDKDFPAYKSQIDKPDATRTYELSAQGPGGTVSRSLRVVVVRPTESVAEINAFRSARAAIIVGEKTVLSWQVADAISIEIDNGVGTDLKSNGTVEVSPETTTTYVLKATDDRGNSVTRAITITVSPPPEPNSEPLEPPVSGNPPR